MNYTSIFYSFSLFVIIGSSLGCISTKKHYEEIDLLKANHKSELENCQSETIVAISKSERLNLQLAERQGEINILMNLRQELYDTISQLEMALKNMGSQSASKQQNLNTELFRKQNSIKQLNGKLQQIDTVLYRYQAMMNNLALKLRQSVQEISDGDVLITSNYDHVKVIISESFLFYSKSTTRLEKNGQKALEALSEVINQYPNMRIMVVGHTDNTPPHASFKDNWIFSVLQSATVAKKLANDFELSHSQITAAGKGEFNPRTSNATDEGKAANRRIELLIAPNPDDLVKAIRNEL